MRILLCLNRDLASNLALNLLLTSLTTHEWRILLSERVGSSSDSDPVQRRELRIAEQHLPNRVFFPMVDAADAPTPKRAS